jgi:flagellar basal body-associated protein FliL
MTKSPERPRVNLATEPAPKQRGITSWLVLTAVGSLAGGAGFAVPQFLVHGAPVPFFAGTGETETAHEPTAPHAAFVPFGEIVVNLAEERLTRYLRVRITLQIESTDEKLLKAAIERNKTILKNWLISYLSDKTLDEVRGAAGVNRVRREIQDQFNSMLFPDGGEIVRAVLFEEFSVQ